MTRKNKVMLVSAIVALALLIGAGVARCSLVHEDTEGVKSASEAIERADGDESPGHISGNASASSENADGLEGFIGTSWVGTEDPSKTLAIVNGAFVEGAGGQNTVTYWTIDSEDEENGTIAITVQASRSMADATSPALVTITQEGGVTRIGSDILSCAYKQVQADAHALQFAGVTSELADSMGVAASRIEAAVSSRAASVSPAATKASWDKEVWIDYAGGTVTTSFTLDDGASTPISVTVNADGSVEAL